MQFLDFCQKVVLWQRKKKKKKKIRQTVKKIFLTGQRHHPSFTNRRATGTTSRHTEEINRCSQISSGVSKERMIWMLWMSTIFFFSFLLFFLPDPDFLKYEFLSLLLSPHLKKKKIKVVNSF